jgi:transposase InsO family protein
MFAPFLKIDFREARREALEEFGKTWDGKYPMIYKSWEKHWDDLSEFIKYPTEIRRAVYTANAVIASNVSFHIDWGLVAKGLEKLPEQAKEIMLHSDQGSQFTSLPYRKIAGQKT